jgi:hypothetical protein
MKTNIQNVIKWEPAMHDENLTGLVHAVSQREKPTRLVWNSPGGFVVEIKLAVNS